MATRCLLFLGLASALSSSVLAYQHGVPASVQPPLSAETVSTPPEVEPETCAECANGGISSGIFDGATADVAVAGGTLTGGVVLEGSIFPVEETGRARLHLYVPSGAYVTINGKRTRNRVWNKHRHFELSGVPVDRAQGVVIKVELHDDNCICTYDDESCLDCGFKPRSCCKTVYLRAGDEEYVTFSKVFKEGVQDQPDPTEKLGFKILPASEFLTSIAVPEIKQRKVVETTRVIDKTVTYGDVARIERIIITTSTNEYLLGSDPKDGTKRSHQKDESKAIPYSEEEATSVDKGRVSHSRETESSRIVKEVTDSPST